MAGGFVMNFSAIDTFEDSVILAYEKVSAEGTNLFHKIVDESLTPDDVDWKLYDDLKMMAPFGIGNERPIFVFEDVRLEQIIKFGKEKNHVRFVIKKTDATEISAIKFFVADDEKIQKLKKGDRITFTANLEKSTFGGNLELRLKLVDIF